MGGRWQGHPRLHRACSAKAVRKEMADEVVVDIYMPHRVLLAGGELQAFLVGEEEEGDEGGGGEEEAVGIGRLDSVAKCSIGEIVSRSGEVLERVMLVRGSYYCLQASRR